MKNIIAKIAQKYLSVDTLETRNDDRLDFYDCNVADIETALEAAYKAGKDASNYNDSICNECGYIHTGGTCWDS